MDIFPTGTKTYFTQSTAPTGWTQDTTTANDCMLRIIGTGSTGGTVFGSVNFSTAFGLHTWSGTTGFSSASTGEVALDPSQIPAHGHNVALFPAQTSGRLVNSPPYPLALVVNGTNGLVNNDTPTNSTGGNPHSHPLTVTGTSISGMTSTDFSVQYIDVIICIAS